MQLTSQFIRLVPLTLILAGLLSYNFMSAQWAGPTATAPGNNTDAPLHTGSATQDKNGYLGLTGLVAYDGNITISNSAPTQLFRDAGQRDWWQHVNDNTMYFVADRNNNDTWDAGETWPHPMQMFAGANTANDFVRFSNQVRASTYCNPDGTTCLNLQALVVSCPAGQGIRSITANGTAVCGTMAVTGGGGGGGGGYYTTTGCGKCPSGCHLINIGGSCSSNNSTYLCGCN